MSTGTPGDTDLELEIKLAKIFYDGSYEKIAINKRRRWISGLVCWGTLFSYVVLSTIFIDEIRKFYPEATYQTILDQTIFVLIAAIALSLAIAYLLVRDPPWPEIFLKYNQSAVQAAEAAGTPLIPPPPTDEERERSLKEHDDFISRASSFTLTDFVMFGAATLAIISIAFKQELMGLLMVLLLLASKFRLMFYGWARYGIWAGAGMYVGVTAAVLAVFAYADGDIWGWLVHLL
jgi:hypothetical protein